jgi:hypothetical protein
MTMPMAIPISPRTPTGGASLKIYPGRDGAERENQKMKEMFHLLRSISFLFRCKAGFR